MMQSSFGAKRKPRIVGQDEGEEDKPDVDMQDSPTENQGKSATLLFTIRDLTTLVRADR